MVHGKTRFGFAGQQSQSLAGSRQIELHSYSSNYCSLGRKSDANPNVPCSWGRTSPGRTAIVWQLKLLQQLTVPNTQGATSTVYQVIQAELGRIHCAGSACSVGWTNATMMPAWQSKKTPSERSWSWASAWVARSQCVSTLPPPPASCTRGLRCHTDFTVQNGLGSQLNLQKLSQRAHENLSFDN